MSSLSAEGASRKNPYVGPRALQRNEVLYGRHREVAELANLLIAERIVLFYAPSGAGKTSLVQAGLIPYLEQRRFRTAPTLRVNRMLQHPSQTMGGANRYVLSVLLTLEEGLPPTQQLPLSTLAQLSLPEYFNKRGLPATQPDAGGQAAPLLLVVDQFEELLTLDPANIEPKRAFCQQLGDLLDNRQLWALFVLREDHLAGYDPYRRLIPTRLSNRLRLELLGTQAALEAVTGPAAAAGVPFTTGAAQALVDSLRRQTIVQPDGTTASQIGPNVEPVQLQVTCRKIWQEVPPAATGIEVGQVEAAGSVDEALADYYATEVAAACAATGVREHLLREWVDAHLVLPGDVRGQALRGAETSQGISNRALDQLVEAHLIRAEPQRGAVWFELAHDRLVGPVRASNREWFARNLGALQRQASLWEGEARKSGFLLSGTALEEAEAWAATHADELNRRDIEFLTACRQALAALRQEERQAARVRRLAIGMTLVAAAALVALVAMLWLYGQFLRAQEKTALLLLEQGAEANLPVDPELSVRLVISAVARSEEPYAVELLHRALAESRLERRIPAHTGQSTAVAFRQSVAHLPRSSQFATAGEDGWVRLWDTESGARLLQLPQQPSGVNALAFSSDGRRLAIGTADGSAAVWDLEQLSAPLLVVSNPAAVRSVALSAEANQLLLGTAGGMTQVWNIDTGKQELELPPGEEEVGINRVLFLPKSSTAAGTPQIIATADDAGEIKLWNMVEPEEPLRTLDYWDEFDAATLGLAISPDGTRLAAVGTDADAANTKVKVWSREENAGREPIGTGARHTGRVYDVQFSPNGRLLATAGADGHTIVWDAATGKDLYDLYTRDVHPDARQVYGVAFSPDGTRLVTVHGNGLAKIWREGEEDAEYSDLRGHTDDVQALAVDPTGRYLASAGSDYLVNIWDPISGTLLFTATTDAQVLGVAFSPDGELVSAASPTADTAVWSVSSGEQVAAIPSADSYMLDVAFSPDGQRLALANASELRAELWDLRSTTLMTTYEGFDDAVYRLSFSPDGRRLATASLDGTARLWDVESGAELFQPLQHVGRVYDAAFDPAGARLLTAHDGGATLWDVATGEQVADFHHPDRVFDVAFSPDGKYFATAGADVNVRVWEPSGGTAVLELPVTAGRVLSVAFSADGRRLFAGTADGSVRQVAFAVADLLELARTRGLRPLTGEECQEYFPAGIACPH